MSYFSFQPGEEDGSKGNVGSYELKMSEPP